MGLKIGITGGIGSGKSTVCKIFKVLEIPVLDADSLAKTIMSTDTLLMQQIQAAFGRQSYSEDGVLDRSYLASKVFSDDRQLKILNGLVHPAVIRAGQDWAEIQEGPYSIKEAALLFESGSYQLNDFNILVYADEAERIQRVMARDQVDENTVRSRMSKQMPEEEKRKFADFEIINQDPHSLISQVLELHKKFLSLSD